MAVAPLTHPFTHGGFKVSAEISTALQNASKVTGVDFQYLLDTAARESGFRPAVKAKTSSASGLFQFIESTWLQMVKEHGAAHGLSEASRQISKTKGGRYVVEDAGQRQAILKLRNDPKIASVMAGVFTQQNAQHLAHGLGRKATAGELYIAHFLGAGNGVKLVKSAALTPDVNAADLFPSAARSNKPLFYKKGQAIGVRDLYQSLVRRHQALSKPLNIAASLPASSLKASPQVSPLGAEAKMGADTKSAVNVGAQKVIAAGDQVPGLFALRHSLPAADALSAHAGIGLDASGEVRSVGNGQIGVWAASDGLRAHSVAGREQASLGRAESSSPQNALIDDLGASQLSLRGLFSKGGLGSKS